MEVFVGNRFNFLLFNVKLSRIGFRWMLMLLFLGIDFEVCIIGIYYVIFIGGFVILV